MSNELSERIAREIGEPIHANNGVNVIVSGCLLVIEPHILPKDALTAVLTHEQAEAVMRDLAAAHNLAPQPAQPSAVWNAAIDIAMEVRSDAADWKTRVVAKLEAARDASPQPTEPKAHDVNCPLWMMTCKCARLALPPPVVAEPPLAVVEETQTPQQVAQDIVDRFCRLAWKAKLIRLREMIEVALIDAATLRPRDEAAPSIPWRTQAMVRLGWLRHKSLVDESDVPLLQAFIEGSGATKLPSRSAPHTDPTLTFAEAIEVLNRFKHGGYSDWWIRGELAEPSEGRDPYVHLSEFEAIAIAEKYLHDKDNHE